MEYDYIKRVNEGLIYGFLRGNARIIFVKAGLGSDHLGYENKYLKMAHRLRDKYGCSVIVAANPYDDMSHLEEDRAAILGYIAEQSFDGAELMLFGHSNGGIKGLALAYSGINFGKMMLVNMPLMINFHKTKRYISAIPDTDILMVYGERDPSYSYVGFIKGKFANLKVMEIEGADHTFEGRTQEFISLPELLFD